MAVTRIKNNQITDATIVASSKVQGYSVTAGLLANNITYGSDLTVTGNLTVQGQTTTIDTNVTTIEDPVILLASTQTGSPTVDIGFIGERGSSDNIAFVWDESADEFVTAFTSTSETNTTITISSYASLKTLDASVTGNLAVTGTTGLTGATTVTGNISLGNLSVVSSKTVTFGDNVIGNVGSPTLNTDAATKGYVDGQIGAIDFSITDGVTTEIVAPGDTITFSGVANETTVVVSATDTVTIGLPDNVVVAGSITGNSISSNTTISATGNITGGNLITAGLASVTGNITGGNLLTGGLVNATGNITGGNLNTAGLISAATGTITGNITGGNISTAGVINATGNITGGNINTAGKVAATGNVETGANVVATGYAAITGNVTGGNLITAGLASVTGNVTGGNIVTGGQVVATGNITGGNINTAGKVVATGNVETSANLIASGYATVTGNITGGNLITAGTFESASITSTGNITGGNLLTGGLVNATGNVTGGNLVTSGLASVTGNITGGNISTGGVINSTGTITGGNISTAGTVTATGNITGGNVITGGIVTATSNVTGGNLVTVGSTNTGTLQVSGNAIVDGNLVVNGNLSYINIDDLRVQDPIIVLGTGPNGAPLTTNDGLDRGVFMEYYTTGLGNAFMGWDNSTGNMVIAASAYFTANDVVGVNSYGTLQAGNLYVQSVGSTGNVTGGNLNTAGQVVATGNITGGNLITAGTFESASISATGNITGGNINTGGKVAATGNLETGANVVATGYAAITGNVTGGNLNTAGRVVATGNVETGANVVASGYAAITGNVTGGNLVTAGVAAVTGNVTGGNLNTAGQVVATGNIAGGNINTTGKVSATGNLETGANVIASGYASVTGNITGGNISTAGVITATGTITGGNLSTAGTATATGNITGGNLITGGLISVTGNINGSGAVFSGNVTASTFIGNISGNIDAGGANTNIQFNDGDVLAGSAAFTFDKTSNAVVASGNITGGNLITAGLASVTGNVTGGNLVTAGLASVTGNVTGGNLNTAGQVVATGNVNGGNVVATALVTGANVTATANVTGANVVGTTSGKFGNIVITGDDITDTNGRVNFNTAGADVDFAVNGDTVANVFYVDAGTGTASFGSATQTTNAVVAFNSTSSILVPVGNIGTRPSTGVTGMLRFNTTNNNMEVYDNSQWTAVGVPSFTVITNDSFAGDGTTVAFTLSESASTDSCIVSINGVVQIPTTAYSVSGTTLTFTEAPLTGDAIDVRILTTTTTVTSISNSSGNAVVATLDAAKTVQITGDLLPAGNLTANLGSPTNYWKTLYVGGNTIYLGNLQLKNDNGTMAFYEADGTTPAPISSGSVDTSLISSGTSSVAVIASGGNVRTNIAGATVQTISTSGVAITGDLSVTGNATLSGNILGDRIQNGTTQIDIQTQNGNIDMTVGSSPMITVTTTANAEATPRGLIVEGFVWAKANGVGQSGNVIGGNLKTSGLVLATGNVTGGNITTGGVFAGSGAQLTDIPGGNVSGTVATATTAGTVTTAAQPNITSVGTLSSLAVTGNITSGNLSGTSIVGTLTTAAQTNITSVGALNGGSITSGFGAIDIGTDTVTCGGIVNSNANGVGNIGSSTTYFNTVFAKATSAQYADLAEKYVADAEYPAGTVVVFGGDKEVTVTSVDADRAVAGVVSTNPSYIMNGGLEAEFVATVALTGRVPCRVTGTINKGDLMVSAGYGLARAEQDPRVGTVIGKALENFEGNEGVIEVVVGRF